jgi:RNA polymerase sigma-70 factor, ECF subfamily
MRGRHPPEAVVGNLVARAQGGDDNAFEELVRRYEKPIYQLAIKVIDDAEAAEDIAVEAFTEAYRDLSQFSGGSAFFTWLYRIALHLCFRYLQRQRKQPEDDYPLHELEALGETAAADETLQRVLSNARREALIRCLGRLTEQQRMVLFLFYFEGYTYLEISGALGIPASTAKSHVRRGTTQLRKEVTGSGVLEAEHAGAFGQASYRG